MPSWPGFIDRAPAKLTAYQLGPLVDSAPEWRDGSVFTREGAEVLISHPGVSLDRRMVYALGVLAGLRPGEAARCAGATTTRPRRGSAS